ncbi:MULTISPECIES: hypothetical protein [unclassified Nocardioides]|uniref:hypothetical protein n=1 Tax=unclassified Nocardioides TaxID=2615069 RepID=UPI0006FFD155|nr:MULTISPECIES: hypothetical protein [unclassified Nocardioides]KRA29706.1 hypothetical protein ASD81_22425 [Nocardioides sp. Root614]KRA88118.1 hypothetical protein ASD84_19190 [Nocardioides sp. Root682]
MNLRPARTAIAVLLTSTLLLAGCDDSGDDGDKKGGSTPLGNSSSDASQPSAAPSTGSGPSTDGGADSGSLDKDSFFETIIGAQQDAGSYRSKATTSTAGIKMVLDSEVTYDGDKILGHSKSASSSPQQIESVISAGVIYLRGDGLGTPAGKWLKLDPNDPDNAGNPLAGLAAVSDPEVALRAMGELDSLKLDGAETIDGVKASHYRAVMVTANYTKELGLPAAVSKFLPAKLPFDIWVDEDNRPVKFRISFKIEGTSSESEQTFYDYGTDVDVTVPKDADTITYAELDKG